MCWLQTLKQKYRVAVLYAKPGLSDDDITDAIDESFDSKNWDYKIILTGDFNIDIVSSVITCLYTFKFLGKNKASNGRSTRRLRSKAGVWARSMEFCLTN
ncbi:hypothetical protein CDAR_478511 [Caerostris darwini]|uniref:Uncharacterized protein n=1 Tax=Caerostris darwini TaxID=1538125 RepID=A0AAV4QQV0_9ARAC|nr:hypothetical protein CDAR_478511 [Caerostris darwini]